MSKRDKFIALAKSGSAKRQDYIDLAIELGLAKPKDQKEELTMPSEQSYDNKTRTNKRHGGLCKSGKPKIAKKGWK